MNDYSCDIAVIGGGASGIAAAVAASRHGASVVLVDQNPVLGGLASNAEVGTICGLFHGDRPGFIFNCSHFAVEFSQELQIRSGKHPKENAFGLKYLPYQPLQFDTLCRDLLRESEVHFLLGELRGVSRLGKIINEIQVVNDDQEQGLKVAAIIDASGNSEVSRILGLPMIDREFRQSISQVFTIKNISFSNEQNLELVLMRALRKALYSELLREDDIHCSVVPGSLADDSVALKYTVPGMMHEEKDIHGIRKTCTDSIKRVIDYLSRHEPAFKKVEMDSVAPTIGIRVGDRQVGKRILTGEDVLEARKDDRFIAKGNWPVEIWNEARQVQLQRLPERGFYDIPMDCLISDSLDNLYFAGRCISATDRAIASARVIGTCLQTGYAAGMYAALRNQGVGELESIRRIQKEQFGE